MCYKKIHIYNSKKSEKQYMKKIGSSTETEIITKEQREIWKLKNTVSAMKNIIKVVNIDLIREESVNVKTNHLKLSST